MSAAIPLVVHSIHDASLREDIGGNDPIALALNGLLATDSYNDQVQRTVLAGTFAGTLETLRRDGALSILFSARLGIFAGVTERERVALRQVEQRYGVNVIYATLRCGCYAHEVLLADVGRAVRAEGNAFRFACWERFGLDSQRHDADVRYTRAMDAAQPLLTALHAIGATAAAGEKIAVAHDSLGLPLLLAADLAEPDGWRTAYYAYSTPAAQRLVAQRSGHDTSFYNVLAKAKVAKLALETIYGSQDDLPEHALLRLAPSCDVLLAVSEHVAEELRFIGGQFAGSALDVVPPGLPAPAVAPEDRAGARQRLRAYAAELAGYVPDYVFAHIDPVTVHTGLWRDLRVLEHLDGLLKRQRCRAIFLLVASADGARHTPEEVLAWEAEYDWPLRHRNDNGDLRETETALYLDAIEPFNRRAGQIRAVLVNQIGWDVAGLGRRMPPGLTMTDCLHGADLVFDQSIYEPFGARLVQAAAAGTVVCASSVCGGVPALRKAAGGELPANVVVADYVNLPQSYWLGTPYDALAIDQGVRDWVEQTNSLPAARAISQRLSYSDAERAALVERGNQLRERMTWESVAHEQFMPALRRTLRKNRRRKPISQSRK